MFSLLYGTLVILLPLSAYLWKEIIREKMSIKFPNMLLFAHFPIIYTIYIPI
ncbi:MAG: hypothetical protein BAJALOKI2v1_620002 [Promethearchaeota archaeon]|nr:MAG: hypothetical protein BAJALOKI2v1_620002 [Candidatus Lokiarchaeota archaeon]